jgi:uroporphyrin-III C-methyltransferase/precorrin-2 dehydrogenase/sirohydrochlorin ferrochelatase
MSGFVSLVGAGLGDPELLTVKAAKRLETAELVLYDALVEAAVVETARHAKRLCVGKRARQQAFDQSKINRLMIRGAQRGQKVVRLKSGDPFVLGRGGEEALALSAAGVAFEFIPGITSAVAAPGLAGVPITHRGVSSAFLVLSGHSEYTFGPLLNDVAPHSMTVIVLMGLAARVRISVRLRQRGWRANTPTAIILSAGTSRMQTWTGTLDELGQVGLSTNSKEPGTIVIGDVVGLRSVHEEGLATIHLAESITLGQNG